MSSRPMSERPPLGGSTLAEASNDQVAELHNTIDSLNKDLDKLRGEYNDEKRRRRCAEVVVDERQEEIDRCESRIEVLKACLAEANIQPPDTPSRAGSIVSSSSTGTVGSDGSEDMEDSEDREGNASVMEHVQPVRPTSASLSGADEHVLCAEPSRSAASAAVQPPETSSPVLLSNDLARLVRPPPLPVEMYAGPPPARPVELPAEQPSGQPSRQPSGQPSGQAIKLPGDGMSSAAAHTRQNRRDTSFLYRDPCEPTKQQAHKSYGSLVLQVKGFVQDVVLVPAGMAISPERRAGLADTAHALLQLVQPRAHRFLRNRASDKAHMVAIIMEVLRREVFGRMLGGVFDHVSSLHNGLLREIKDVEAIVGCTAKILSTDMQDSTVRLHRAQLLRRVVSSTSLDHCATLYIDALGDRLAGWLLPLCRGPGPASDSVTTATLEWLRVNITGRIVLPAVQLALSMELSANYFEVRWVQHKRDCPNAAVCDLLELDLDHVKVSDLTGDYRFLFDLYPALYMKAAADPVSTTSASRENASHLIHKQGVIVVHKGQSKILETTHMHMLSLIGEPKHSRATPVDNRRHLHRPANARYPTDSFADKVKSYNNRLKNILRHDENYGQISL